MNSKKWKSYLGSICLCLSFLFPALGFVIPFLGFPISWTSILVGVFTCGVPEIMIALAVIFLGKETLLNYRRKFFTLFKRLKPWKPVSKFRYYFGLVIFIASPIPLYLHAYGSDWLPSSDMMCYMIFAGGDLAFVLSFFILGPNFWEKFKNLFIWNEPKPEPDALP